jgi:hypothetical protein
MVANTPKCLLPFSIIYKCTKSVRISICHIFGAKSSWCGLKYNWQIIKQTTKELLTNSKSLKVEVFGEVGLLGKRVALEWKNL